MNLLGRALYGSGTAIGLAWGVFSALGCENETQVASVAQLSVDLDQCYGQKTNCEEQVTAREGNLPEAQSCDATETVTLDYDSSVQVDAQDANVASLVRTRIGRDGSIWTLTSGVKDFEPPALNIASYYFVPVAGTPLPSTQAQCGAPYRLSHYDSKGHLIASAELTGQARGGASFCYFDLFLDPADHAIAIGHQGTREDDVAPGEPRAIVIPLDSQLHQVTPPVAIGHPAIPIAVSASAGEITLAATAFSFRWNDSDYQPAWVIGAAKDYQISKIAYGFHGVLARFKAGVPIWKQSVALADPTLVESQITGLAAGSAGHSFVLGVNKSSRVHYFDANGNLKWALSLPMDRDYAALTEGPDGGVMVRSSTRSPVDASGKFIEAQHFEHFITSTGDVKWSYPAFEEQTVTTDLKDGRVLMLAKTRAADNADARVQLDVISKDGKACQRYNLSQSDSAPIIFGVDSVRVVDGVLHIPTHAGVARYRLPAK